MLMSTPWPEACSPNAPPSCRYFALVRETKRWFDQFAVVSELDLEDFGLLDDAADPGRLVKRFRVS